MEKIRVWSITNASDFDAPEERNSGDVGDLGTDLKIGGGQLLQATAAVGDLFARPFRSEGDETFSERLANSGEAMPGSDAWMAKKRGEYSDKRQASEEDFESTRTAFGDSALGKFGGTIYGLATNPRATVGRIVQSAPAMLAGGGIGGAVGKAVAGAGARAATIARAANLGSAAAEGVQSGANNAYDLMNYNVRNGRGRYEGVGGNQLVTALGVGMTSLVGAKVGGGIEASLFNKEARRALKMGNKGTARAFAGEGGEEAIQSVWEDVPQNFSMDRPWDEGLYEDMAEGGFTGGLMGGGVHGAHRLRRALTTTKPTSMLGNAPTQDDAQEAQPEALVEPQRPEGALDGTAVEPQRQAPQPQPRPAQPVQPQPAPAPQPQPTQQNPVSAAVEKTPMPGAQPAPPTPAPQPSPEEIKAQQKALAEAEKNFRKRYGLPKDVHLTLEDVQADAQFRTSVPPVVAQAYDAAMRGTAAVTGDPSDSVNFAKSIRDWVVDSFEGQPEGNAGVFLADLARGEKSCLNEGDTEGALQFAASAYAFHNPQDDLKKFVKDRRQKYDEDAYQAHYGHTAESPKEAQEDATWRRDNEAAAPLLDVMVKANAVSGANIKMAELRRKAGLNSKADHTATLASLQGDLNSTKDPALQGFFDATLEILNDPERGAEAFLTKQQTKAEAEKVAVVGAAAVKAAEATDKQAEAIDKGEKPTLPSADAWLKKSKAKREELAKKIESSGDEELVKQFHKLRDEADKFEKMQAAEQKKHDTHEAEKKAEKGEQPAEKKEAAPKPEKPEAAERATTHGEQKTGLPQLGSSAGQESGQELVWTAHPTMSTEWQTKHGYVSSGKRYRVWKVVNDEYKEAERLHGEDPSWDQYGSGDHVTHRFKRSLKLNGLVASPWRNVRQLFGNNEAFFWEQYFSDPEETQNQLHKKAKVKHLDDLEAIENTVQTLYTPDFSFGLDWLREKAGRPKKDSKSEVKAETPAKVEEIKPEAPKEEAPKPEPKPAKPKKPRVAKEDNSKAKAYLEATRDPKLLRPLQAAGLIAKRNKGIPFQEISSPEFQQKVLEIADPVYIPVVEHLRDVAQAYDPSYKLEIPTPKQVREHGYDAAAADEGEKIAKPKLAAAPKTSAEEDKLLHDYFMAHQTTARKLFKEVGDSTGKSDEDIADALVKDLARSTKNIARRKYLRLARGGKDGASTTMAKDTSKAPVEEEGEAPEDAINVPEVAHTSDESTLDEINKDTESGSTEGDLATMTGMRIEANGSKVQLADGIAAGGKITKKVMDAYKAADLPDLKKTPTDELFKQFEEIEKAVVAKLPKKLTYSVDGKSAGFNADGVQEALMEYLDFMNELLADAPEEAQAWITQSPLIQWGMDQMSNATNREEDGGTLLSMFTSLADDVVRRGDSASVIVAMARAAQHKGDGGWFRLMRLSDISQAIANAILTKPAEQLLSKCCYWRDAGNEGVMLPLQDIASISGPLYPHLSGILEHTPATMLATGVQRLREAGLQIPNAYVVDRSRQVFPSRDGLKHSGLDAATYGGEMCLDDGTAQSLSTGASQAVKGRIVLALTFPRKPFDKSFKGRTEMAMGQRAVVHEALHALDATVATNKLPSANLREALAKLPEARALADLSYALAKLGGDAQAIATKYPDLAQLLQDIPAESLHLLSWNFEYPYAAAKVAKAKYLEKHEKDKTKEVDASKCYQDVLGMELLASYGSAMIDQLGTRQVLEKYFPAVARAVMASLAELKGYKLNAETNQPYNTFRQDTYHDLQLMEPPRGGAGKDSQNGTGGDRRGVQGSADSEQREAPAASAEPNGKDTFTQDFIRKQLKKGPAAAKLVGIAPSLYETEEWKAAAQAYTDAAYAVHQADGSVGGCRSALNKNGTPEAHLKLQDALKRQDEAKLKESLARQAFNDFEDAHRAKVEPPKGKAIEQVENQFAYNKLADAAARRLHAPWLRKVINDAGAWGYRHGLGMMFTRDLVDTVKDKLHSVTQWAHVNDLIDQEARTHQDKAVKIGQDFRNLSQKEQDTVNDLLMSSVMDGVWYDIPVGKDGKPISKAEVADSAEYAALSKAAKQVYRDVLRMGVETRNTIRKYTAEEIERRYDDQIANASDEEVVKDFERQKTQALLRLKSILPESDKPYVPLRRFGKYVVTLKTQDYVDAVAAYQAAKEAAEDKEATRRDKRDAEAARQKVLSMQSNGKDYVVEYAESSDDAMVRAKELEKDLGGTASYFERSVFMKSEQTSIHQLLNLVDRTERQVTGADDDYSGHSLAIKNKLNELATTLYIQSLSDNSALKSRLPRRKVAGASRDMMRSFMATASSESRYLGYLKHGGDLRKALSSMEDECGTSDKRAAAAVVFNEVRQRIEQDMTPQSTASSGILRTTSVMMLLTNPSFFLQNLTQPLMYSATYMGGRFGLYQPLTQTARQMKSVAEWLRTDGTLSNLDKLVADKKISTDERKMLETMRENGLLDIGLSQEFGEFNRATLSPTMGKLAGWTDMLAGAARKVEVINRVSSALVAYRLEKARLMGKGATQTDAEAAATKFADHVLYETHGDYSSRNSPRYFKANDFARVVTQFRKFQLIQLGLFTRMLRQALDKTPSEERHFARLGLAYTMGTFLAVTGVKGLPLYGVMAIALGLAGGPGDDDEDVLRKTLADAGVDKPVAELLVRGLPAMLGLDLSDKLGAGNVLSPFPYLESNKLAMKNGPDDALEILSQVMGPAASLLVRASRGASYGWQGDYTKAAENLLPSGFANVVKATRFGLEGLTTKAGDVVIPGEQFTFGDLIMQGIGLPTTTVTNRNLLVSSLYRHEETYNQWAKEIRYSFTQAVKNHDIKARSAAVTEWKRMNEMRRKAGFAPNKLSNLVGSIKAQRTRERGAVGGVETNKSNKGFVKKAHELYS